MIRCWTLSLIFALEAQAASPVCASRFADFDKSPQLKQLQAVVPPLGLKGFVNGTQGSYFFLQTTEDGIQMTFLTTGLFDFYGIRREGPIQFCDLEGKIFVMGLGYEEEISVFNSIIQLGGGTPRQTFREGPVPDLLKRKHDLTSFSMPSS